MQFGLVARLLGEAVVLAALIGSSLKFEGKFILQTQTDGPVNLIVVDLDAPETDDPRDYDIEHYVRQLRETFAARLARAFRPQDFVAIFEDPDQLTLLPPSYESMRPILTSLRA